MKKYLRSEKYDQAWIEKNWMGPNPMWLLEDLCEHMELKPGMKVLDMGCGKGITTVFLAKEYGVTVFANDLWVSATDNLKRFEEAGIADKVFPLHAEAHALPYAEGFFDAAISIDSYQYYGTDEMYFPCIYSRLVKPGGQFGIVVPGLVKEYDNGCPDTLKDLWQGEMFSFHSKDWWQRLWEKTGIVEITACYNIDDPKDIWWPWAKWAKSEFSKEWGDGGDFDEKFLQADTKDEVALVAMSAVKKADGKTI